MAQKRQVLTVEEKKAFLDKMMEYGRNNTIFYYKGLTNAFPEYSGSTYSKWVKDIYGVSAVDYFTEGGAIFTEEERVAHSKDIFDELKNRYAGKEPAEDYYTLEKDNRDIDFYYIHLFAESLGIPHGDDYYKFLVDNGCLKSEFEDNCKLDYPKVLTSEEKKAFLDRMMESGKEKPVLNFSSLANRFPEYNEIAYQNWVRTLYKTTAMYYFIEGGAILTMDRCPEYAESCFKKLKQRYSGNKTAKDYESLVEENKDINFDLISAYMQSEDSFFDQDSFENTLIQKGFIKASESGDRWCFSPCVMRASLEAEFPDGKKYKYRAKRQVKVGDCIFIERGYKTSGQFGKVTKILKMTATKKSYTAVPQFSFIRKPTPEIIKKNASEIIDINSLERMSKKFDLDTENFAYVDVAVEALLKAASVLAFPELSTKSTIKKAASFLHERKTVPAFLFGDSVEKGIARYSYFYILESDCYGTGLTNIPYEYQIVYTGFYPDWEKSFFAMPIWSKIRQLGNEVAKATCTKEGLDSFFEEYPSEDEEDFYNHAIGYVYDNSVYGCMNKAFEDLVNGDEEYHKACNELIFRSALSVLIKGNLANLLDAFLSANPPIEDFRKELVDYSKECASLECTEILNKYFN